MAAIRRHLQAELDLLDIVEYLAKNQKLPKIAFEFVDEYEEACLKYARQPEMGTLCSDILSGMRCFTVKSSWIVYYLPLNQGIEILRVIHGSRDQGQAFSRRFL